MQYAQNLRIKTDKLYKNNICSEISLTEKEKYAIIQKNETGYKFTEKLGEEGERAKGVYHQ